MSIKCWRSKARVSYPFCITLNRPSGNYLGHLFCEEQIDQDGWDGKDRHNSELSAVVGRVFSGEFHNGERNGLQILRGEEGVRHILLLAPVVRIFLKRICRIKKPFRRWNRDF